VRNSGQADRPELLKELLRKAALLACDDAAPGEAPVRVADAHLATALDQLLDSRNQLTRVLLGGEQPERRNGS
jgi:hypothetical protein